jgi:hypothetical protein
MVSIVEIRPPDSFSKLAQYGIESLQNTVNTRYTLRINRLRKNK